ncbi:MAG: nuclear transport factor 2 family protein [Acidobacteriia bacterium]|nr:nuclear transport factor 2 family protein [Terriglobia bacterium]
MKRHIALAVLAVSMVIPVVFYGCAVAEDSNSQDREQILSLEREWVQVYVANDAGPLQHIVADDFLGTEPDGKRVTKADLVAEIKGPSEVASNRLNEDDVKMRFYGTTAVVNGSESWKLKNGKSGRYIWTDIFVKRNGKWQVVASQDLAVPDDK